MATIKELGTIKVVEIIGRGENISDTTKRIFLSKSGAKIIEEYQKKAKEYEEKGLEYEPSKPYYSSLFDEYLDKLELYYNKKGQAILTIKKDLKKITFNVEVNPSFRGTSGVKDAAPDAVYISATGSGRIGEHTEAIVTLPENSYIIFLYTGRYSKGYICYKNEGGELKKYEFKNDGKYCDMPSYDEALIAFGLAELDEE